MQKLTEQKCEACEGGTIPFSEHEASVLLKQIPGWELSDDSKSISRKYDFGNFKQALAFINRVGDLAEAEGHHPDINLFGYKHVLITLTTHAIKGLSNNDFIMAAKIDENEKEAIQN